MLVGSIFIQVLYVTMVYGPIAAFLVESFPAKIRYTSLSLPYHFGNGWFGGFTPVIATSIVAATGNRYAGLWFPISVAAMTFVVGAPAAERDEGSADLERGRLTARGKREAAAEVPGEGGRIVPLPPSRFPRQDIATTICSRPRRLHVDG